MPEERPDLEDELLGLGGGDPFGDVLRASNTHRDAHDDCALYPAGPRVMSLAAHVARIARPRRVLDLGCGIGYSTLWLASASPRSAEIIGIDIDPDHVALAEQVAREHAPGERITFWAGVASEALADVDGPIDFVHDDAWFADEPAHYQRVVAILRPGGVLTMPNWFLLEDALHDPPGRDWASLGGPRWRETTRAFAATIAQDRRLRPVWVGRPPLLVAVRTTSRRG